MSERDQNREMELNTIAGEALQAAKDRIVANMRFLDPAVFALKDCLIEQDEYVFATDGKVLYYSPSYVFACCQNGLSELVHNYLHVLLHCIFHHLAVSDRIDEVCWNLSADIAVEALIQSFGIDYFESVSSNPRQKYIRKFQTAAGGISAERLYRYLKSPNMKESDLPELEKLFMVDNHEGWYSGKPSFGMADSDSTENSKDHQNSPDSKEDHSKNREQKQDEEPDWDSIAQMVKVSLEAESSGIEEGNLLAALNASNARHIDYSTFLRKFALQREALKVDDNEFDYIYYTYGLELYGDMPLVEPLEYSDEKSIRDLAIVIDTSASTEGELVESFIQQTFDMLLESKEFQHRFNIHLIQCDMKVQDDQVLRNREDIRQFMERFEIRGLGGTDYRPAFQYVNTLLENGAFSRLQGLLYFTDGKGIYPRRKPSYDTAFIFGDEESAEAAEVPSWGMKVVFGGNNEHRAG